MLSKIFKKNIYYSVALVIFLGLAIPFFFIGLIELNQIESDLMKEAKDNINHTTKIMAQGLSRALWEYSVENVEPVVDASFSNEYVTAVTIMSSNNKTFYAKKNPKILKLPSYNFSSFEKIFYNDREIGNIKVDYSLDVIHLNLKKQTNHLILSRIFQISLSLFVILYFLHFRYIKRINLLITQAQSLVKKNLDIPFLWGHGDPINELGRDLEQARVNLKDLFAEVSLKNTELSEINLDLEKLVEEKSLQVVHSARMAALGEMAASIAHEINNPLTVISGRATIIEKYLKEDPRKLSTEDLIESVSKINKMSFRIAKIVKSLKFFSRNSENDQSKKTPLHQIFDDSLDLCQERMKDLEINFTMSKIPEIDVEVKSVQLSQVILNLLNNALDAIKTLDNRWLRVDVSEDSHNVIIRITDSGVGIPKEIAERIMQPFFTTKGADQGTGLGLSISAGIIKSHGGNLYLDSEAQNTSFVIELPKEKIV